MEWIGWSFNLALSDLIVRVVLDGLIGKVALEELVLRVVLDKLIGVFGLVEFFLCWYWWYDIGENR
jgi:hypothetical protein